MSEPFNPYKVLGVRINASQKTIKSAYRYLSKKYHPDHNPGDDGVAARFEEIQRAWDAIGTPEAREQWDATGTVARKCVNEDKLPPWVEGLILPTMNQILQNFHNYKTSNLVKLIQQELRKGIQSVTGAKEDKQKALTRLKDVVKRIRTKGETNVLKRSIESNIQDIEYQLKKVDAALADLHAAVKWLDGYEYVTDPSGGFGFGGLEFSIPQLSSWAGFGTRPDIQPPSTKPADEKP